MPSENVRDCSKRPDLRLIVSIGMVNWESCASQSVISGAQSLEQNAALMTRGINAPLIREGVPSPNVTGAALTDVANAIVEHVLG